MGKGLTGVTIFLLAAILVMGIVFFANKLNKNATSVSEIAGGVTVGKKCADSDGADAYTSKGTCRGTNGNFIDYCQGSYVMEYYCSNNRCLAKSVPCPSGYSCSDGACVAPCTDECSPLGYVQCTGYLTFKKCGNYDSDTCLEWGSSVSCPSGYTCSGGTCVASSTFDFSLSVSPISGIVVQGSSITATVTTTLTSGSTQLVSFSASSTIPRAIVSFSPTSCYPTCTSTMTISTNFTTPMGTYTIIITATGGGKTRSTTYTLTVH